MIFRGKFRLAKDSALHTQPGKVWQQDWVFHCNPMGYGRTALKYLAPYVFRVAISNRRLVKMEHDQVTFRYRTSDTGQLRLCTLSAEEFIHRFLQHVLPKGFVKIRYFGFFGPACRSHQAAANAWLQCASSFKMLFQIALNLVMQSKVKSLRLQRLSRSYAVQVVARLCAFSKLFNLLDAARHEPVCLS